MNIIKKIWEYGSKEPIQRIGILILIIGLMSLFSWMYKRDLDFNELFNTYYLPEHRDFIFFHLYLYLIPIGLLMSWGYSLILKIKKWIFKEDSNLNKKLNFKDSLAAFKFAATVYKPNFEANKASFGLIQNVLKGEDGKTSFLIQLASQDATTFVLGYNSKYAKYLKQGDLVYWGFDQLVSDRIDIVAFGHVLAVLKPEFDMKKSSWTALQDLTK